MNKQKLFSQLWEQYSPEVFRFCMFRLSNKENAEDITAEVFIRLYQEDINSIKNIRAWLFTVSRNLIYDLYVKKKQLKMSSAHTAENIELTESQIKDVTQNAEKIALDKRMLELIEKELRKLPSKDAEVIILKVWHDLSFKEIAGITDLKESAVKQRFYRNLEKVIYNINTPPKRRFRFRFKLRTIALTTLIAGIFKISLAGQYHVHAESLTQSLNIKLGALGVGSFMSSTGLLSSMGAGAAGVTGTGAVNTAALGAGATATTGGLLAGASTLGGGATALSGGAQIAIAAITTAAVTTGSLFGISKIQDIVSEQPTPTGQSNTISQIPTNNTQSQSGNTSNSGENTNNTQSETPNETVIDECTTAFNGSTEYPISFNYNSCVWTLAMSDETKSITLTSDVDVVTIAKAQNIYGKQFDTVVCEKLNAAYISDHLYRVSREENVYSYEPTSVLENKRSITSNPSEVYCPTTTQAFNINNTYFVINYKGTTEKLATVDSTVNSITVLSRDIDEGDVKAKIFANNDITFTYPENLLVTDSNGIITIQDTLQVQNTDLCTKEVTDSLTYPYITIEISQTNINDYKNSIINPTNEILDTVPSIFETVDLFGKEAFIEKTPNAPCGFIRYIVASGNSHTLIIHRKVLGEDATLDQLKQQEDILMRGIMQSLRDLKVVYQDVENPAKNVDIQLFRNDAYEFVTVWRTVRNSDTVRIGLDLLIAGPDDSEKERGYKPVIQFASGSTCGGQNYALQKESDKIFIQFCKDITSSSPEHQKAIVRAIYDTIEGISSIDYINIKDKNGNCLFDISVSGLNNCKPVNIPLQ